MTRRFIYVACSWTAGIGCSASRSYIGGPWTGPDSTRGGGVNQAGARKATAVTPAHNPPSGVAEPSQADEIITTRLRDALALVDIRVLDHLVIGDGSCTSLAERGIV